MKKFVNISVFLSVYERLKILFTGRIDIEGIMSDNSNIKQNNLRVTYGRKK